jgi:hypothetical protein
MQTISSVKTTLNNYLEILKRCTFAIYPYTYFVAKVEVKIRYIKIHMKMRKFKCICIAIHISRKFVLWCTCNRNLPFFV